MDKTDNVLDVTLPRKWIRIAFNNWFCTGIVSAYMALCGALGIGGLWLVLLEIFEGEWSFSLSEDAPFLFLPLIAWAFYFQAKLLFSRILPGRIQIVGVEVVDSADARALVGLLGRCYWFKGASMARVLALLPFNHLPVSLALKMDPDQRLNRSRFRKTPIIFCGLTKNSTLRWPQNTSAAAVRCCWMKT